VVIERTPGVTVRLDATRAAAGKRAWGVFVDVMLDGKRLARTHFFPTEAEANVMYTAAVAEVRRLREEVERQAALTKALAVPALPEAPKGTVLFEPLARRWLKEHIAPPRKSPNTWENYERLLRLHLFPIMRTWPVTDQVMGTMRLTDVLRDTLAVTTPEKEGLSLSNRVACQRCLSSFFGWARTKLPPGQLLTNPAAGIEPQHLRRDDELKVKLRQEPNPMTRVQVEAFLTWQKEHHPDLWPFFVWLVDEGSRQGEVSAIEWDQIFLAQGKAYILQTFSYAQRRWERKQAGAKRGEVCEGLGQKETKTHRTDQYIDLSDRVREMLPLVKAGNLEAWMKRGRYGKEPKHVFLNSELRPRRPDNALRDAFAEGCAALELVGQTGKPFTIHCLRDTFATLAILEQKLDLGWVALMLGHSSEETLKEHYYKWVRLVAANPLAGLKHGKS
jgi:integrase